MKLLGNAIKSNCLIRNTKLIYGVPLLLGESPRTFSTEMEQQHQDSAGDPFRQPPTTGLVYGRLTGTTKYTLKTDIVNLLEGCNLSLEDVKVDYNRSYMPNGMMVQFPSRYYFDNAIRVIGRKGRLYRLERVDRSQWDLLVPYDGKAVILEGIPRNASVDEVERFLSGYGYDGSSFQMFVRQAFPEPIKVAIARLPSQTHAMNIFIMKNRGFILNNRISVRVLQ